MTLQSQMALDLTALLNIFPISFTVGSGGTTSYTASKTKNEMETKYTEYGEDDNYQFSILTSAASFAASLVGEIITISGKKYRVLKESKDAAGVSLKLDLGGEFS